MLQWSHQAQFAGYYVALEKGFYKDKGLDVSIVPGGPGLDAADFLIRGQVDFASLWLSAALARSEKDIPLVNLAQVVNSSNLVLMTWKKDNISTLSDLSGKKISVWGGDFRAPYAAWLQAMNARPELVPQYYSVNLFLQQGVVACSAMYYNEVHMAYQTGIDMDELKLFFLRDDEFGFPEDGIYITRDALAKNPEQARNFREASLDGWKYAAENPDEALEIVMQYVIKDNVPTNRPHMKWMLEKILTSVIPGTQDAWAFGRLSRQDYSRTVQVMRQQGLLQQSPTYEDFTDGGLGYVP
ncbi:MAG: transporter substrate-binding protein [Firmicutes bacterium]|nr:transporter substrate-binding protein [Bacillota bacterium]